MATLSGGCRTGSGCGVRGVLGAGAARRAVAVREPRAGRDSPRYVGADGRTRSASGHLVVFEVAVVALGSTGSVTGIAGTTGSPQRSPSGVPRARRRRPRRLGGPGLAPVWPPVSWRRLLGGRLLGAGFLAAGVLWETPWRRASWRPPVLRKTPWRLASGRGRISRRMPWRVLRRLLRGEALAPSSSFWSSTSLLWLGHVWLPR